MGNCCMRESLSSSSTELPGDEWGPILSPENYATSIERQRLLGEEKGGLSDHNNNSIASSLGRSNRELKIKISKRELEELMARIEIQGLSMEQVLASLVVNGGHVNGIGSIDHHHHHHRSWKPALQSIPEVN